MGEQHLAADAPCAAGLEGHEGGGRGGVVCAKCQLSEGVRAPMHYGHHNCTEEHNTSCTYLVIICD